MKTIKLLLILFFIFFSSLIRVPAYSIELDFVGMENLLTANYKIIYSDQREDGIMSFLLKKTKGYGSDLFLCKVDNSKRKPINMGCFPFPLDED